MVVVFCYAVCTRKNWYFRENQFIVIFKDDLKEEFIIKIKKNGFCRFLQHVKEISATFVDRLWINQILVNQFC